LEAKESPTRGGQENFDRGNGVPTTGQGGPKGRRGGSSRRERDSKTLRDKGSIEGVFEAVVHEPVAIPGDQVSKEGDLVEESVNGARVLSRGSGKAKKGDLSREVAKGVGREVSLFASKNSSFPEDGLQAMESSKGGEVSTGPSVPEGPDMIQKGGHLTDPALHLKGGLGQVASSVGETDAVVLRAAISSLVERTGAAVKGDTGGK
jgi:hypothetical protein